MVSSPRSGETDTCKPQFVAMSSEIHRLAPWLSIRKYDLDENLSTGGVYGRTVFFLHMKFWSKIYSAVLIYSTEIKSTSPLSVKPDK